MLKHIPPLLTPPLVKLMMEMGHGEVLLLSDANYPSMTGSGERICITNCTITDLLKCVLYYFPLDKNVDYAASVMQVSHESGRYEEYRALIEAHGSKLQAVERFEFYKLADKSVANVITTDMTRGANLLIQKGVVTVADLPS